jgi:2-phospho-L-lactate guanylyltransferase
VPFLDPSEVDALLERAKRAGTAVSIVPDRHSRGTNGLLLHPPDAVPPAFGAGSCARHRALAMAAGASSRVEPLPSLALDVDTAADLDALVERLDARPGRAWATRRVVPSWPPEARRRGGQTTA